MTSHTPTPWVTAPTAGGHQHDVYSEQSGKTVALVYTDKGDADFIVKAVNAHAELLRAISLAHFSLRTFRNVPKVDHRWTTGDAATMAMLEAIMKEFKS